MMIKWLLLLSAAAVIAASNPEEESDDPNVYEGDMILTAEQRAAALHGQRASINSRLWPKGLFVYEIDSSLAGNSRAVSAIRAGISLWQGSTCIRFKQRTNERAYARFKLGQGCSSYVGRTGNKQDINLASGCWHNGIVAHEIGHALGFYHEQSRPDRDNYVLIKWENIKTGMQYNFQRQGGINSLGTEYDYGSLMHYQKTAFSKNGQPTIESKKPGVTLGQRGGPSRIDIKQMKLLYKCGGGGGGGGG
ncbi:blastula protease 10, partial [Exaiptasia diaphana]|uniref:Metalloendopeptidase n=1 Tax=Exaiptasia diaphana TaxID=2652724 RepID=A0A913XN46_EXADI